MKINKKTITSAFLLGLCGIVFPTWATSNEEKGKEIGKKIDHAEEKVKEKAHDAKEKAKEIAKDTKEKGKELHDKAKDKAHEAIDKS
jgi:F0F1-type ATP synthase membrane subunit b/b'